MSQTLITYLSIWGVFSLGAIVPGASLLLILRNAITYGRRIGIITAIGASTSIAFHTLYSSLGVSYLVEVFESGAHIIQIVGGVVLLFFSYSFFKASRRLQKLDIEAHDKPAQMSAFKAYRLGLIVDLTNPFAALYIMSIFSTMTKVHVSLTVDLAFVLFLGISNATILSTLVCFLTYSKWRCFLSSKTPLLNLIASVAMLALAVKMFLS